MGGLLSLFFKHQPFSLYIKCVLPEAVISKDRDEKSAANLSESLQATCLSYLNFYPDYPKNHWWNPWATLPAITFPSSSLFVKADEFKPIHFT